MKFSFDPRLITEIVGKGNYTQFRSILDEYIANAWDAEADRVELFIPNDFETGPIRIVDNGNGIGDVEQFTKVGSNIQLTKVVTDNFRRNIIGKKGIGRFAGFACGEEIVYESRSSKYTVRATFSRKELLKHDALNNVDIPYFVQEEINQETGTTVTINYLDGSYTVPAIPAIEKDLLLDFGIVSDFQISLNGEDLKKSQVPGEIFEFEEDDELFGHVNGNIIVAKARSKKQKPGIIVRVKNRRVEGPDFFGVEDSYTTKILNRIYGDINADGLDDIISSGREAFIQHDQKYQALRTWIQSKIVEFADNVQEKVEVSVEKIIFNFPSFQRRLSKLPEHVQSVCTEYIKRVSPKLNRIKNDYKMLELFGLLILRASENTDFYGVLVSLESAENMDVSTLAKVLEKWGISEVAHASYLVQNRITILNKFTQIINDKKSLELQDLHRILEYSTWILDDRYTLFSSNEGLGTVIAKLQMKYEGKQGRNRPDLILKRDRKDFVLIELKAPSVRVTMTEVTQALEYQSEILNHYTEARDMDIYLIGRDFDDTALRTFMEGNPQRVHLLTLQDVLQQAQDRMNWLTEQLADEYEYIKKDMGDVEIVPELAI